MNRGMQVQGNMSVTAFFKNERVGNARSEVGGIPPRDDLQFRMWRELVEEVGERIPLDEGRDHKPHSPLSHTSGYQMWFNGGPDEFFS